MKFNNTPNEAILVVTGVRGGGVGKRNRIDAADHLIINVHHLLRFSEKRAKKRHGLVDKL